MGSYNRFNAWLYAVKYAHNYNPDYRDYSGIEASDHGGDCTNFISQCLYAGGWSMIHGKYYEQTVWYGPRAEAPMEPFYSGSFNSNTWSSAPWFLRFLKSSERGRECGFDELDIGDLVIEYPGGHINPRHIMLVTEAPGGGEVKLSYHSSNTLNKSLNLIKEHNSNANFVYYKVNDFFPRWLGR